MDESLTAGAASLAIAATMPVLDWILDLGPCFLQGLLLDSVLDSGRSAAATAGFWILWIGPYTYATVSIWTGAATPQFWTVRFDLNSSVGMKKRKSLVLCDGSDQVAGWAGKKELNSTNTKLKRKEKERFLEYSICGRRTR